MKIFILTVLYLVSEPTEAQKKLSNGYPYVVPQTLVYRDRETCERQVIATSRIHQNRAIVLDACSEHKLHLQGEWTSIYPEVRKYILP